MKARFVYSFIDIESNLLKKEKGLRSKNKYSLKEAEEMVSRIQNNWGSPTTITLKCTDTEDGNVYDFDKINITPFSKGASKKDLLPEIETQLIEASPSVLNNADVLIRSITDQYEQEPSPIEDTQKNNKKGEKKKSRISFSFPLLGNKNKTKVNAAEFEEETNEVIAYEVQEEVTEEEQQEIYEDELPEEDEVSEEESGIYEDEDEESNSQIATTELAITNEQNNNMNQQNLVSSYGTQNHLVNIKKHETVILPKFEDYIDIGNEIIENVKTMEEKLSPDNLFKFTHFSPGSISNTKLDQYRQSYIRKCLSEPKFEILREHYWKLVREIQGDGSDRLREAYERAALADYPTIAKENISEVIEKEKKLAEDSIWSFVDNQERTLKEKEIKKREESEAAINAFIAQKNAEVAQFVSSEKERIDNIVEDRKTAINTALDTKLEKMIEEEWYNVKANYNRNLIDGKRLMGRKLFEEIQKANEDVWKNAQIYIDTICNKVDEKMPEFADNIKSFNALEKQQHDIDIDVKKIAIEESKAKAEQLKAEQDLEKQRELIHENNLLKIRLETEKQKRELLEERQKNVEQTKEARGFGRPIFGNR